jgi:hypothetical protein
VVVGVVAQHACFDPSCPIWVAFCALSVLALVLFLSSYFATWCLLLCYPGLMLQQGQEGVSILLQPSPPPDTVFLPWLSCCCCCCLVCCPGTCSSVAGT